MASKPRLVCCVIPEETFAQTSDSNSPFDANGGDLFPDLLQRVVRLVSCGVTGGGLATP